MSLYREYRQRYPQLLGMLENARKRGRFAHSFLVCSEDERVRREFPIVLAELAHCSAAGRGTVDPDCPVCSKLERGLHPEYYTISPSGKLFFVKVGDTGTPEPNTLRWLLNKLYLTSAGNLGGKTGVILEADRMNDQAQNALLKTLEEPPPDTVIILSTGNPSSLLPTTRSRCQILCVPSDGCRYEFEGAEKLYGTLRKLCFGPAGLLAAEEGASALIAISGALNEAAEARVTPRFERDAAIIDQAGDSAATKRLQERIKDAVWAEYMMQRRLFTGAIEAFCDQVFLLACGADPTELPAGFMLGEEVANAAKLPVETAERIRKEAEDLIYTLRFNVSEELALRTFAVNLATLREAR